MSLIKHKNKKAAGAMTEQVEKQGKMIRATFSLNSVDHHAFQSACIDNGESMSAAITRFIREYAKKHG